MPLADFYLPHSTVLHRLDPRVKLCLLIGATVTLLTFQNVFVCLAWLAVNLLLFRLVRAPWSRLWGLWGLMLPVSLLMIVTWPLVYQEGGPVWLDWGWLKITAWSVAHGVAMALRLNALAQLWFLLLLTTDQTKLVRGLVAWGVPFEWGLTVAIALRYIPVFLGAFQMIAEAQQARGLQLARGSWLARVRAYGPILVAMLITALRAMDDLAWALEVRALGAVPHRTAFKTLAFTSKDWLTLVGGTLLLGGLLGVRLALNWGAQPFYF